MIYIETGVRDAAFNFSVEEYVAKHFPRDEPVMMLWQASKCVMLGSNQIAEAEVDIGYSDKEGIQIVRRSSGGGTIFTDFGTLLYTVIRPYTKDCDPLEVAKECVAGPVAEALRSMGVPAKIEGRNDILVEGKKVSGFAQYIMYGRINTHGSLLFDTDLEMLSRVLRPDEGKVRSKAIGSVRSRVTNISDYMDHPCTITEFKELLKQSLFAGLQIMEHTLTDRDLFRIGGIYREKYGNPSRITEQAPKFSYRNSKRFAGGRVDAHFDIAKGVVTSCKIRGDFLSVIPIGSLEKMFEGKLFQRRIFAEVISGISLHLYLGNITGDEFLSCIFE